MFFLASKNEAFGIFKDFSLQVQNECDLKIVCIRSDHGGEFENSHFIDFCKTHGIRHEFSSPRTPQQNGVVERRNRILEEMSRTMLCENSLPKYFLG